MFNFEGRQNLDRLAALCCPSASRVIMLLVFAALLALAVPAAHAAGCTGFEYFRDEDSWNGEYYKLLDDPYYVIVPASNFLSGIHKIYINEKCDVHPANGDDDFGFGDSDIPGSAFAKNGRKAMEICELNLNEEIAEVRSTDPSLTMYYCVAGERKGPERQRRESLFVISFKGNAKGALKKCQSSAKIWAKKWNDYPRPNHVEPYLTRNLDLWTCYHVWKVNRRYLRRVGA